MILHASGYADVGVSPGFVTGDVSAKARLGALMQLFGLNWLT